MRITRLLAVTAVAIAVAPVHAASAARITIGKPVRSAIATPGDTDTYRFTARAGQRVFFDAQETGERCDGDAALRWKLDGPRPRRERIFPASWSMGYFAGCEDYGPYVLKKAGTYTLTVFGNGDATAAYGFQLWDAGPDRRRVAIGDRISGDITTPGNHDEYTFRARAGQRVFFDAQQTGAGCDGDAALRWKLDGPRPRYERIFPASWSMGYFAGCEDYGPYVLKAAGDYVLTVFGNADATAPYAIQLWDAS